MSLFEYISANSVEFTALGAALLTVGGIVVKLTPTKADDIWWQKLMKAIGRGK